MAPPSQHAFRFFRAGGFDQVRLDSGADLLALGELDQKLWVALACPITSVNFEPRTLKLLDTNGDGRVRAPELIQACQWAGSLLNQPDDLLKGSDTLPLAAINLGTSEGKTLFDVAQNVLKALGKQGATAISVAEASDALQTLYNSPLNGDGIIVEASATTPELQAALKDVLACTGGEPDRSGKSGVGQTQLDAFFLELEAFVAWRALADADPAVLPLGDKTAAARELLAKLAPKVDDFFARCRLVAFDSRAADALNRDEKDFQALASQELSIQAQGIAAFPLARVEAGRALPLEKGLNPAWADLVAGFRSSAVAPLLGERESLTEADWSTLRARFAAYDGWVAQKKGAPVEKLGIERAKALLSGSARQELAALVQADKAVGPIADGIAGMEKLVRLHRDLYKLCNNFVSFRDFYSKRDKGIFQAGTLYIDQRSCDLCVKVDDVGKHATMASLARTYLVYCECHREGQKMTICAAFTAGDSDTLMVGRNGIFYDRAGQDWDATITRIVDNPISVRQAFWAPYKKALRFIEEQVAKRATDADTAANARLTGAAAEVGAAAESGKVEPGKVKIDIGVVAALGVAVGGITAAMGALLQAFFGLGIWMPIGLVALLLAISGPSMAIAYLKLRQRNLAPILDANGWAMNSPARINIPFGASLTQVAVLPPGSARELSDPYAEKEQPWGAYAAAAAVAALCMFWGSGKADPYLPENVRKETLFPSKTAAPAAQVPSEPAKKPDSATAAEGPR
ncbi:hypothetical protein P2318_19895 [Myxococcaceae bacterium GXIMD 01537]